MGQACRNQARQTCHHTGHILPNKTKSFAARTVRGRNIETNRKNIQILRRITLLITRNYIFLMIKNAPDIYGKNSFPTRCCFFVGSLAMCVGVVSANFVYVWVFWLSMCVEPLFVSWVLRCLCVILRICVCSFSVRVCGIVCSLCLVGNLRASVVLRFLLVAGVLSCLCVFSGVALVSMRGWGPFVFESVQRLLWCL